MALQDYLKTIGMVTTGGLIGLPDAFERVRKRRELEAQGNQELQQAFMPPAFQQADLVSQDPAIRANANAMQQRSIMGALAKIDPKRAAELGTATFQPKAPEPLSAIGKSVYDLNRIDPALAQQYLQKQTTHRPSDTTIFKQAAGERQESINAADAIRQDPNYGLTPVGEQAINARSALRSIGTIDSMLDRLSTNDVGKFSEVKQDVLKSLGSLGVKLDEDTVNRMSNFETLQAATQDLIAPLIKDLGAGTGLSDKDAERTEMRIASVANTIEGARLKNKILRETQEMKIERNKYLRSLQKDRRKFSGVNSSLDFENHISEKMAEFDNQASAKYNTFLDTVAPIANTPDDPAQQLRNFLNR